MKLKQFVLLSTAPLGLFAWAISGTLGSSSATKDVITCNNHLKDHVCIMKTVFGFEELDTNSFAVPKAVKESMQKGLSWIDKAQGNDGGWGAGSHHNQGVKDPHAVKSDPATTSLVAMSLLRTDNTPYKGLYSNNLKKATEFLLKEVENCPANQPYLTTLENTQPQVKLGRNIDVILTSQFFTNLIHYIQNDDELKKRVEKALDKCIARIQKAQSSDGGWNDGGWAPVLQSALANNALETAKDAGRKVDTTVLQKSRAYQNGNFDTKTNKAVTGKSAGIMLYSLSSTTRASAQDARKAKDIIQRAKKDGKIRDEEISEDNLRAAGVSVTEAKVLDGAYRINEASRKQALRDDVMTGFGNNGGEEFLSYLMTGESIVMQGGDEWKKWYDRMSGTMVRIQNQDGSWNGHHCITSPVFCTATCLLILSIHNDMQFSMKLHQK